MSIYLGKPVSVARLEPNSAITHFTVNVVAPWPFIKCLSQSQYFLYKLCSDVVIRLSSYAAHFMNALKKLLTLSKKNNSLEVFENSSI